MELNTIQLAAGLFGLALLVAGTIVVLRQNINRHSRQTSNHYGGIVSGRTKTAAADISRFRGVFLLVGVMVALAFALLLVSWTQTNRPVYRDNTELFYEDVFIVESPRTTERSKPRPPEPEHIIRVPEVVIPVEAVSLQSIPEKIEIDAEAEPVQFAGSEYQREVPVFMPQFLPEPDDDLPFLIVEQMPRFPGCEDLEALNEEKYRCAEQKLLEFIRDHLKYPAIAKENHISGKVIVRFVVEKDGSVGDVEVLRDIGGSCGDAAIRVVHLMNELGYTWTPGKQRGVPVRVQFTMPVSFKLH